MRNVELSSRGTSWVRVVTSPGFRKGFMDARLGLPWATRELGRRNFQFGWWYEFGRLFAVSPYSAKWDVMPAKAAYVNPDLIRALQRATEAGIWPVKKS
jgi:hypothetical protein